MTQIRPTQGTVTLDGGDYDTIRVGVIHVLGQIRSMLDGEGITPTELQIMQTRLEHIQTLLEDPIFKGPQDRP